MGSGFHSLLMWISGRHLQCALGFFFIEKETTVSFLVILNNYDTIIKQKNYCIAQLVKSIQIGHLSIYCHFSSWDLREELF